MALPKTNEEWLILLERARLCLSRKEYAKWLMRPEIDELVSQYGLPETNAYHQRL